MLRAEMGGNELHTPKLQTGFTPLFYASESGHLDVMELLIERDAQIDLPAKV